MNSPGPSATDIQSHLYNSFIHASTYDVAIRVSGRTWRATYRLHRVVLIQSGFFRALFTAGFSESQTARKSDTDEINVTFDDCNITRPAFEICISRLYGGGPLLFVSPNLIPTTEFPLTPPFSGTFQPDEVPPGHQPADHRFLLSLLATSIYLSIPSVAAQTLSLILKTVGPTTIRDYLNFACGISLTIEDTQTADVLPAVGLENIAVRVEDDGDTESTTCKQFTKECEVIGSLSSIDAHLSSIDPEVCSPDSVESGNEEPITTDPSCHYGKVSDKIGEACACWLTRWAIDMLQIENEACSILKYAGGFLGVNCETTTAPGSKNLLNPDRILIWRRGGLTAKWVSAIISANTLFVKNERERYNLARTIVEFRRRDGIIDDEEGIWNDLFKHGIHYTNMTFEDLHFISQDTSPSTTQLYAPLRTLQAAYWNQSILRSHITSRPSSINASSGGISPSKDKELGICLNTTDILSKIAVADQDKVAQRYFPVFSDQSLRIGDGGNHPPPSTMEDLFNSLHQLAPKHARTGTGQEQVIPMGTIITTEEKFFGILTPQFLGQDCVNADGTGKARWSPYPPYRFSVEFWDVDLLKEKSRLHSQTIWYAGSLFNVYVQLVRKKGQLQLGIYLHRQSHVDPIPTSSTPPIILKQEEALDTSQTRSRQYQSLPPSVSQSQHPSSHSPSFLPVISSGILTNQRNSNPTSPPSRPYSPPPNASFLGSVPQSISASHPYRDQRSSITAYFAISCASATGSSQTRFSSSPDTFSVSQSWGWKSSSLRTEEFLEVGAHPLPSNIERGKEVSLRATVVLGLV